MEIKFGYFLRITIYNAFKEIELPMTSTIIIIGQVNSITFLLQLSKLMKIHPIFHISILEPFHESTIPRKHIQPISLIKIDEEKEFEVVFKKKL